MLSIAIVILSVSNLVIQPAMVDGGGSVQIWNENPYYWEYKGEPVLLLGGSDEDNLFNKPDLMMRNLETLQKLGGNYIRCTLSCRDEGNVWPYQKVGELYDLNRFNPEFWERLENCLRESQKRDIIVQIEFWATFDFYRDYWLENPFNPALNSNYTTDSTTLETEWDHHPARKPQPFFHSPPKLSDDEVVRAFQEAFIRKVLDISLGYPNVLYCLDNETSAPPEWAWYWAEFILKEVEKRGSKIQLTEMWDDHDLRGQQHRATYEHPELFSFVDISQNNWQSKQTHYDRILWIRETLARNGGIRPMNNVKVYARTGDPEDDLEITKDRWWQNIFAGCASTRFHRPPGGIGLSEDAQIRIRAARQFTSQFHIFRCEPRNDLLSQRDENEAYCLAAPGEVYAVYFPGGGDVLLSIQNPDGRLKMSWFDPLTSSFNPPVDVTGERSVRLKSPDTQHEWLVLLK